MFGRKKDQHEGEGRGETGGPDMEQHEAGQHEAGGAGEGWFDPGAGGGDGGGGGGALDAVTRERDEFKDKWLRAMAEYQNYQRRAIENEKEAKRQGVTSVLMSVVPVLDSFDMALTGSPLGQDAAMSEGLKAIQQNLLAALASHGVSIIRPAPGDEFDPNRHSAIMQMPGTSPDGSPVAPGHVSQVLQVGYVLNSGGQERVIRSAKVAVVPAE